MNTKIMEYITNKNHIGECANIVIAGCSCSGKTTLAEKIQAFYPNVQMTVIHEDDYFKNLEEIPRSPAGVLADRIDAFHTDEFVLAAKTLLEKGMVAVPVYDVSRNIRTPDKRFVARKTVNIFEGLHAISLLKGQIDCLAVYLDISYDECLRRRIARDRMNWNIEKEKVVSYWNRCIMPVTREFIAPQRPYADIIEQEWGK